jgi:peptide deformylase
MGLAAPQIGEFVQVAVIHYPPEDPAWPIINPEIDAVHSRGQQVAHEGCLSIPLENPVNVRVMRCQEISYSYQDIDGHRHTDTVTGIVARAVSHEVDHLQNIFYIDRLGDLSRSLVLKSHRKYVQRLNFK